MTALPATLRTALPTALVEAEATAFAREWLTRLHTGGNPWSGDSPFTTAASLALTRDMLRRAAMHSAINRMQVIALARAGDADAITLLKTLIIEMKSRHEVLPIELENYNLELLHDGMGHQAPGPKRKNKLTRNICIAMTVAAVIDRFGLPAVGRSPHRRSACAIVAEALQELRMQLGYKAVETIWNTYSRAMPTVPGWASR